MKAILHFQHHTELSDAMRDKTWSPTLRDWAPRRPATFASLVANFPECVREVEPNVRPIFGSGYYVEGPDGFATLLTSNYDSSD